MLTAAEAQPKALKITGHLILITSNSLGESRAGCKPIRRLYGKLIQCLFRAYLSNAFTSTHPMTF